MRLKTAFPLFCISLVSGPAEVDVNSRPLSLLRGCPPAALTSEDHQAEAPLGVPQRAASQQDLVVVQAAGLSLGDQVPFELVQPVVGGLTLDLTWRRSVPQTSAPLDVQSGRGSGVVSPLNRARTSVASPMSPVVVRACFTFRLVSLEHNGGASSGYHNNCGAGGRRRGSDSPVQFGGLHVDQVERFAAGQQQEVGLESKTSASGTTRDVSVGPLSSIYLITDF